MDPATLPERGMLAGPALPFLLRASLAPTASRAGVRRVWALHQVWTFGPK